MSNIKVAKTLPDNYDPLKDEVYMSPYMLLYFKDKLEEKLHEVLQKENQISHSSMDEPNRQPDHVDQGIVEELRFNDFALQEYEDSRRIEIEEAIQKIMNGSYGYCDGDR